MFIIGAMIVIGVVAAAQMTAAALRPSSDEIAAYDFTSCKEARAAGAAPLKQSEPWYRAHLDADGDGVACEVHPKAFLDDLFD